MKTGHNIMIDRQQFSAVTVSPKSGFLKGFLKKSLKTLKYEHLRFFVFL